MAARPLGMELCTKPAVLLNTSTRGLPDRLLQASSSKQASRVATPVLKINAGTNLNKARKRNLIGFKRMGNYVINECLGKKRIQFRYISANHGAFPSGGKRIRANREPESGMDV
jgi:hypothetical protein